MKRSKQLLLALFLLAGCGSGGGGGGGGPVLGGSASGTTPITPGCNSSGTVSICVTTSSASLPADGTSTATVTAAVTSGGMAVPDGTTVNFTASRGTLSSPSAATTGGDASVTYTAGSTSGTAIITASFGGVDATISITLSPLGPSAGGIQFLSANPNVIGLSGGGQVTSSIVTFRVTDSIGTPVPDANVSFSMIGPVGANITPLAAASDGDGQVSVTLNSGTVAGPVTITAIVTTAAGTFSASSSVISIGGGTPSATHFDLAAERLNLPGLVKTGFTTTVTVYLADRFSNYNVLEGTSVSFYTEAGAIDRSMTVDPTGIASVILRTQLPMPEDTPPQAHALCGGLDCLDGWVSVIATVRGEESFIDANGNGVYDAGEVFTDLGEPFIDANDNGSWNAGEFYVDDNNNGVYDGPNVVWDGPGCTDTGCRESPLIWRRLRLMFTGHLVCSLVHGASPADFAVPDGGQETFIFTVSDINGNMPVPGTTITITTGAGVLLGQTSFTVFDGIGGPFDGSVILADNASGDTNPAVFTSVTLKVTAPGNEVITCPDAIATGTVD